MPWVGCERWLHMLRRMEVLTAPLVFHGSYRAERETHTQTDRQTDGAGTVLLSDDRRTMTKQASGSGAPGLLDATLVYSEELADPTIPMRRGRHYAEFSLVDGRGSPTRPAHFSVGIVDHSSVRPSRSPSDSPRCRGSLEPPSGGGRARDASAYLFDTKDGQCLDWTEVDWARHSWQMSAEGWRSHLGSERIGLLLDVEAGKLSVYRGGIKLGTMVRDLNKQGHYVWVVQIMHAGDSVRVDGPLPSPAIS